MRKIKSVKLAKEFNNGEAYAKIGTELNISSNIGSNHYCLILSTEVKWCFALKTVIENMTGLFTIEYEPEGFEFKQFFPMINFNNKLMNNTEAISELNRLADWCDGQSAKDLPREYFVEYDDISLLTDWAHDQYFRHGLKFNSNDSASLFITELNKPENSDYKNYFIELLKKTRL